MVTAIVMERTGGVEVLRPRQVELPPPGPGEVRVRHAAIGVNFVDIYHRTGLYPLPALPAVPGVEGAGRVEAVGEGVAGLAVGDRVAYAGLPAGGYAEARNIPAARLVRLPDGISETLAAASMLRGLTAHMLLHRVAPVKPGDTVLIHAAAGGLGLILTQWAKRLGATTIGTVGSDAKAQLALDNGLDHAILYREADFAAATRTLTGGRGVDAAFDGIGGDTLARTLDCVRPFGMVASIGQADGPLAPLDLAEVGPRRSLSLSRPSVFAYANNAVSYAEGAAALFAVLADGLDVTVGAEYPLADAADAHRALEGGRSVGSLLLVP
ncbi:MAG: quinone oxidoreductase family protein [Bacteroidales bacterium]